MREEHECVGYLRGYNPLLWSFSGFIQLEAQMTARNLYTIISGWPKNLFSLPKISARDDHPPHAGANQQDVYRSPYGRCIPITTHSSGKKQLLLELDSRRRELRISQNSTAALSKCKAYQLTLQRRLSIRHATLFIPQGDLRFKAAPISRIGHQLTQPHPNAVASLSIAYSPHCLNQGPVIDPNISIHTLSPAKIPLILVCQSLRTRMLQ